MAWRIRFTPQAQKDLGRIDLQDARRIRRYLHDRVAPDPRAIGGPLKGQLREFWRYRVGGYRILTKIEDEQLLVLVVRVAPRNEAYGGH